MQTSISRGFKHQVPLQIGADLPPRLENCEAFQFNPAAAPFRPEATPIASLPDQLRN